MSLDKKPWIRPEVKKVPLLVKEAVLASCKSGVRDSAGPGDYLARCEHGSGGGNTLYGRCSDYSS